MKQKRGFWSKKVSVFLIAVVCAMLVTGCGEEISVSIFDCGEKTEITTTAGKKVSAILDEAGITLGEKDEVEPAVTERIKEPSEIQIKRFASVTIIGLDGKEYKVELIGGTVADAVQKANITLEEGQVPDQKEDEFLKDGMTITIIQQTGVNVTADGETKMLYTSADTVGKMLEEQNIELSEQDRIEPSVDTVIESDMEIVIRRVEIKEETVTETIEYDTETEKSSSLASGKTEVKQEGVDGEKDVVYKITYVDGEEEGREIISETVTKEPVAKIIVKGTKKSSKSGSSSSSSGESSGSSSSSSSGESSGSSSSSDSSSSSGGRSVASEQYVEDCDGSGHGAKIVTYDDGSQDIQEY